MAFPDTFVKMSEEFICKVLPLVGLGTKEYIKAGHAALVLVHNETGEAHYYDFGRYVTPKGFGRVRGAITDVELSIPFTAEISETGVFVNLNQFLLWLEANPQKTHGEGRLIASVCDKIDYDKAKNFIEELQHRGSIPYGAFDKMGSNCSRFVTDTILASTEDKKIIKALSFNKKFTPSTVGNVEKAASLGRVYEVCNGALKPYDGSALKENLTNYFQRNKAEVDDALAFDADGVAPNEIPVEAQKLHGIGSSAWFLLTIERDLPEYHVRIRRYNDLQQLDYDGVYSSEVFNSKLPYQFVYDSNCSYCHVLQGIEKIKLMNVKSYAAFNSSQTAHAV